MTDRYFGQPGVSGVSNKVAAGDHDHPLPIPTASITAYDPAQSGLDAGDVQTALDTLAAGGAAAATVTAAGTGTSLITTGGYVAFPVLCRAANGDLLLFYRRGTDHNVTLDGSIYLRRSTDDGATWGSESTVWNHASLNLTADTVLVRRNGDVIVGAVTADGPDVTDAFLSYTLTSTDHGATWGSPVAMGTVYGTGGEDREVVASLVELPDDTLLAVLYVRLNAGTADKIVSFLSTDDGATWDDEASVVSDTDSWSEPRVALLDDGSLFGMVRNDTDKDLYTFTGTYASGAVTWTTPALAFAGWGFPRFRQLNSGALAIIYRQDSSVTNGRAVMRVSYDAGATWSAEENIEDSGDDMMYADLIPIPGSTTVRVAYSIQNSSTDADIYVTTLTDIADVRYRSEPLLTVAEEDGDPIARAVRELRFPADAVTVNGDGSVSITTGSASDTRWEPLTNGDAASPELIFASGDVIMVEV